MYKSMWVGWEGGCALVRVGGWVAGGVSENTHRHTHTRVHTHAHIHTHTHTHTHELLWLSMSLYDKFQKSSSFYKIPSCRKVLLSPYQYPTYTFQKSYRIWCLSYMVLSIDFCIASPCHYPTYTFQHTHSMRHGRHLLPYMVLSCSIWYWVVVYGIEL